MNEYLREAKREALPYLDGRTLTKYGYERDSQRERVYDAEDVLVDRGKLFLTVGEIEDYLANVIDSTWFKNRFPWIVYADVRDGRGRSSACGYRTDVGIAVLKFPRWSRWELFILHELSHAITKIRPHSGHGRWFCSVYLALIRRFMGHVVYADLRQAFQRQGVHWHRHRARQVPHKEMTE